MKQWIAAAALVPLAWVADVGATGPALADFLKQPQYESMTLSPRGDYVAARVPFDDRTVLAILRLADMQVTAKIDPGRDGFVESETWVSDTRLFASVSIKLGTLEQPYMLPNQHSVDVDGRNGRSFPGYMIDPLIDDPEHVLTSYCRKVTINDCWTRVRKMRSDGLGSREDIVDAPIPNADFLADRSGTVRFSWNTDDDDRQQVYLLRDGTWTKINDEQDSGIESTPIGTSYDRRYGFLWSERKQGPDVIERIDLVSGERTVVASDPDSDPQSLVWSFDGHEPIGAVYGGIRPQVRFFDTAHPHAALSRELIDSFPGELARVTSASRDGRRALVTVTSAVEPERFYLLDTASGDLKLLARSRPWLAASAMRPSTPVTFTARDGVVLHGWLNRPAGDGPHPLVVMPHGGPFGVADGWAFADDVQMLATRGYAVLRINFRGSKGRGRAFIESGYRQWGRAMQDDLTDATRWAIEHGGADASRICIWGESYGGYAALMGAVREPELYRCVVGMAGPYDLPTLYRWGDTQRSEWGRAYLARSLGEDQAQLRQASPTAHAGNIRARVMLVQGMRDRRVSPEHLRAMRRALDEAKIPYDGYFPSDETHGFYGVESRRKYYESVLRFLDRSLAR
ncbi:prolyl oligopeptidase family serine peptidase [Lysobacter sp. MMG2]|uniref:alpha/beta hydrolase family protein n=1 Tax=Lysobacter sp. MMG2 TaxID=2801338 RepID=UPI001C22FC75|nr:prolyl oligopeptidase family serine peptidase [Lysobacter sp. MMG2]MBU8975212.1 prolyl oligopeptidase family serine peptidase [Lysobacter sp. MMG2]